ncbi:ABC transporter ATP-binding protein [Nonomuraea sp. NPDC050328]|uniref:ABC transporter ATP-binding protein n=1 Tax=Nonomuraea sp. NPDC050328 TaxID=3364361 RepID=UPI0037996AA6
MIRTQALSMTFRSGLRAVDGLDLTVEAGETVAFLGPNGAGKTTTMRMLATLLRPTGGRATVAGRDLLAEPREVRRRIGYVSQAGGAGLFAPLGEELLLQAMLYGMRRAEARRAVGHTLDRLGVTHLAGRLGASLSGGEKRRFDLAFGLLHRPDVLFLDEPSTGLDPGSRAALWEHVRELGVTTLLTTHYLEEAEALADRVVIISRGRIVADAAPDELRRGRTLAEAFAEAVDA